MTSTQDVGMVSLGNSRDAILQTKTKTKLGEIKMKKPVTIYSNKNYPLQAGRQYAVSYKDYWVPNSTEDVCLTKINRYGQATILVSFASSLVSCQHVVVNAADLNWVEI